MLDDGAPSAGGHRAASAGCQFVRPVGRYMPEPYGADRVAASASRKAAIDARISAEPFKPANPAKKGILG